MKDLLEAIIEENRYLTKEGKLADYIPALSKANIDDIGLCLIDSNNNIYKLGDYSRKFTLQSISKVLSLILAIMDNGLDYFFQKVGCESTDEPFNSFIKLDLPNIIKPTNPMINAGAIVTTSMIKGNGQERIQRLLELVRLMAKNDNIHYNEEVYISEKSTGDRNRAMAYLMSTKGILQGNVEDILDTYFLQCSIEVDTIDLAQIGKFISQGCKGLVLPSVSKEELTILLKSILLTCGMYNYSSRYAMEVGIPSKSGVSGGIMGVLPNDMGIGIYSPGLDVHGNSIAGIGIIKSISKEFGFNIFK